MNIITIIFIISMSLSVITFTILYLYESYCEKLKYDIYCKFKNNCEELLKINICEKKEDLISDSINMTLEYNSDIDNINNRLNILLYILIFLNGMMWATILIETISG